MKSLIPMGRDYIGSGARLQEDLPRHLARALLAGVLFGEPTGPASQEQGYLRSLLKRPVGPLHAGLSWGFDCLLPQDAVERVGEDAGPGVAHERSPDEGRVGDGGTEGEERYIERVCYALFQVRTDDQIGLRCFDAGRDLIGIFLDESPFCEGVGVEEEVPFEVRQIRPTGDDLQPDLAGKGVTETKGVGEVPEYGDPAVLERLRRFKPRVPRELRRAGQLGPDRTLHGFG